MIRCWRPEDAPLLKDAVDSSLDHLRPWLAWARDEPQSLEEKVALLRRFRGAFDLGQEFMYGLFTRDESRVVGGSGLHTRAGDAAFEMGYWIRVNETRRGLVTESTAALTRVGLELCGADRIEIRVDPANEASLAVPRKLGFREDATLRRRLVYAPGEPRRDVVVFSLFRAELEGTPAAAVELEAFDAAGARVV